jgi:hypothetical protein
MNTIKPTQTEPAAAGSSPSAGSAWWPLFDHMSKAHGLTLLDDELNTIAFMADESRLKSAGGVSWILTNALRHLTCDELHNLGDAIAKRSGGTYSPNDPNSATRPTRAFDCNLDARAGFAAVLG